MKALLVVDIQKDFCPGGALAVKEGDTVVKPVNDLIEAFAASGLPVVLTRDWHPADHSSFADFGGIWPTHCVAETSGAEFHKDLTVPDDALIISKAVSVESDAYSGFEGTDLDSRLKKLGVDEVVVAGLATDYCVKNTVLDALRLGYKASAAKDCMKAVNLNPEDGAAAEKEMLDAGAELKPVEALIK
jgi:nicotinamidase/pyrazinamidase